MLAVSAIGMVSALGLDLATSCAAARAGIRRIVEIDDLYVNDLDGDETAPIAVHRVPRISFGLNGFARLLQLGLAALADLRSAGALPKKERLGMILLVERGTYEEAWEKRQRASGAQPDDLEEDDFRDARNRISADLLPALIHHANLDVSQALRVTLTSTSVGFIAALRKAEEWLNARACDRCIVGGVDSLLDPSTLAAIDGLGLLRTPDRSVGILPGEGACFLLLHAAHLTSDRRLPILALLDAPAEAREAPHPLLEERGSDGGGLSEAISRTLSRASGGNGPAGLVIANLNGDPYRAESWARSVVRVHSLSRPAVPIWIPPLFFGEIGAVTGPVSVALAARGWSRRYAPSGDALLCLMDDLGARGALCVRGPREQAA